MAKKVHDDVLDGALSFIVDKCDRMTVCAGEPASFAEADEGGARHLATAAMASADFTVSDGATSGRQVVVAQKGGVTVAQSGSVDHVALLDTAGSRLLYVTTCAAQVLTAGNSITLGSWAIEIADPS